MANSSKYLEEEAQDECDEPGAARSLDVIAAQNPGINRVEVLHDRIVPGSDCGLEHVVVANHAVVIIRSTPKKGRVRITKDTVYVGGSSLQIMILGLKARIDTARHMVGGESPVFGAIFLSRQPNASLKHFGSIPVGSPAAVVQHITEEHCKAGVNPNLEAMAYELNGIFLRSDVFEKKTEDQLAA